MPTPVSALIHAATMVIFILSIDIIYFSNFMLLCSSFSLGQNSDISKSGKHLYLGPVETFNPWFITGLTDGDGSFSLKIVRKHP